MMSIITAEQKDNTVIVKGIRDFDLKQTFECGQCFRWNKETDGSYTGVASGRILNIKQQEQRWIFSNTTIEEFYGFWYEYFDLNRDYDAIKKKLSQNDPIIKKAVQYGEGIRILNQDEWETLISFIISQNRSIPIIKKNIEAICSKYGNRIGEFRGKDYYDFPFPEKLAKAGVEDIGLCKVGYRAKYINKTAQIVKENRELHHLRKRSMREVQQYLLSLPGVGPKVAHCIMLFSMQKYESFPVDVWIMRIMKELYGLKNAQAIHEYALKYFNIYGGFAQQYLFYYAREKGIGKQKNSL